MRRVVSAFVIGNGECSMIDHAPIISPHHRGVNDFLPQKPMFFLGKIP
jgi:hypothetical protein